MRRAGRKKYFCEKFNEEIAKKQNNITDVILSQFGLEKSRVQISVNDLYMPQEEQDKMEEFIKNHTLKKYNKKIVEKEMSWIKLGYFPTAYYDSESIQDKRNTNKK